jgi:hypothetical protein
VIISTGNGKISNFYPVEMMLKSAQKSYSIHQMSLFGNDLLLQLVIQMIRCSNYQLPYPGILLKKLFQLITKKL